MKKYKKMILTAGPSITEKEIEYVNDAVSNGWNDKWNEYILKFQNAFSKYIGVKHALATSSCTRAMHLGLKSFGINDEFSHIVGDHEFQREKFSLNKKPSLEFLK